MLPPAVVEPPRAYLRTPPPPTPKAPMPSLPVPHTSQVAPLTAADMCRYREGDHLGHHCLNGHISRTLADPAYAPTSEDYHIRMRDRYDNPLRTEILREAQARGLPFVSTYVYDTDKPSILKPAMYNDDDRNSFEVLADLFNTAARRLGLLEGETPEDF